MTAMRTPNRRQLVRVAAVAAPTLLAGAALQYRHRQRIARDPEQAVLSDPPRGRRIEVRSADGTRLHAEVFGDGSGQTFVLAHGWTERLQYWTYVIRGLAERGHRVVAYDLRGHGDSDPGAQEEYAIERFGEDLEAVLQAVLEEGQRAIVVGHSLGAMSVVAWGAAHDVERHASAIALINTGVGDLVSETLLVPVPALARLINETIGGARFMGSRAPVPRFSTPLTHAILRYIAFGPAASPAQIAFYERMLVDSPADTRADIGIALSELEIAEEVPRLTVPTLVMAGDSDRLTPPSHARRIAEALPSLHRLIVLERTGHMSPLERPGAVVDALDELARSVRSVATATA